MKVRRGFVLGIFCGLLAGTAVALPRLRLVTDGRSPYIIALSEEASETERFAAEELAAYVQRISGAALPVRIGTAAEHAIVLRTSSSEGISRLTGDAYAIILQDKRIYVTGGRPRAVLYAVYDLLERLGCRWTAPGLEFYNGAAEFVPKKPTLEYAPDRDVIESPVFSIRKLDTGGARSHTAETLREMIAWMGKLRFNTLMVSMTAGLGGNVDWDDWRNKIEPELEQRDMLLQVGGHGYHKFLDAEAEGGRLFERHPDWFGRDENCEPRKEAAYVFNTGRDDAVEYLIDRVVEYVKARPEIDIFGFWPPDMARWADCAAFEALGSPQNRQARLVTRLHTALKREAPDVRLEMIAYEHALIPPALPIPEDVLVDFCPLSQNFDAPIYDPAAEPNGVYVEALAAWRKAFPGTIGLYSYYRKYAWRSLPNLIPHYMQQDLKWYASVPLDAASSYAEPGDWSTYELNHYVFGHLLWNPSADVDRLISDFCAARYGRSAGLAKEVVTSLENVFRPNGSIPYSDPDPAKSISTAHLELSVRAEAVRAARESALDESEAAALDRLSLMLAFALCDLRIQQARSEKAAEETIREMVEDLVAFLTRNKERGTFLVYGRDDLPRYLKHYTRDWSKVTPGTGI